MRRGFGPGRATLALLLASLAAVGCPSSDPAPAPGPGAPESPATLASAGPGYVGRASCAGCHPEQEERWRGSHHDLAMQPAGPDTVLGDFDDASLDHFGLTSRFTSRDGRFFVRTDGPDGKLDDFEIAYTFGVEPLQQYLVRFDDGRLQALGLLWDARDAARGGQRWFHLYPDPPVRHDDELHWTRPSQNWNGMCADCHSTGVERGYDPASDRFATRWQEIDVSCEACHGPGSDHVARAEAGEAGFGATASSSGLTVDLRRRGAWRLAPGEAIARREGPPPSHAEVETCAPCHARRSPLGEGHAPGRPFLDAYRPALLDPELYHADGQILGEVYVWGSFLQSRMFAAGVSCSDCHDPHSLEVASGGAAGPDAACASCHRPEVFAAPTHHGHAPGGPGSRCVDCHMPTRTYMGVDARRDHGFRAPRPDLSEKLGVPNACTGCHPQRTAAWAAEAIVAWRGDSRAGRPHFGEAIDAGRRRAPGADSALAALALDPEAPGIVRATALRLLRSQPGTFSSPALVAGLADADPLVRLGAVEAAERLAPASRLRRVAPLLDDPTRAVRIQAALALLDVAPELWGPGERTRLAEALAEYRAVQRALADRPESHLNLGFLHARFGELDAARREYETALRLDAGFLPAHLNLADLHRQRGRDDEAERVLRAALAQAPESADAHHALGLLLVREGRLPEAVAALERAAVLAPERARFAYVHGIALHSTGDTPGALAALREARGRHPRDRELLLALATVSRDAGRPEEARRWADELRAIAPDDPTAQALLRELDAPPGPALKPGAALE